LAKKLTTKQVIEIASKHMKGLAGHEFDLLTVQKPVSPDAAVNLAKVISKLSPLLGNMIEFNTCEYLSDKAEFKDIGKWRRQDPGFPDAVFEGDVTPTPGFEIKAWFPLATEITARFKDSQNHFTDDRTYVAMLAWLPERLIYGKPYILDVVIVSGASVAKSRDDHYHNPPDYLVLEPEDTKARTRNLQQTNTNGYKFQGTDQQLEQALKVVDSWGKGATAYSPTANYQAMLRQLIAQFPYRLDTNYAKMDRIVHPGLEEFKTQVGNTVVHGMRVRDWEKLIRSVNKAQSALAKAVEAEDDDAIGRAEETVKATDASVRKALKDNLGITEADAEKLLK
jgi:hypothetical protein